jgi:rubrerythrin
VQDVGGAEVDASRRRFLQLAAPVAAGGLAAFLAACGSSSDPQTAEDKSSDSSAPLGGKDLELVNFALTLEYVERDFYDEVIGARLFTGAEGDVFKRILEHEHEHVAALEALAKKLGGPVAERPSTRFPIGSGRRTVLDVAATLENVGAAAYLGQVDVIENRGVLAAALSIHSVEARHAAALNELAGRGFGEGVRPLEGSLPDGPFAKPMGMDAVLRAVRPYMAG